MPREAHTRVRVNGTLGTTPGGYEIFSYGFALSVGVVGDAVGRDGIMSFIRAYHSDPGTGIAPAAVIREIAFHSVDEGNTQIGNTIRVEQNTAGGGVGVNHPPQVSYRVSLDDGVRGRSHRGGWYVPLPTWGVSTTSGVTDLVNAETAAANATTLIDGVNALFQTARVVCIASVIGNLGVSRVRVGRALDTIRSRRNALDEAYVESPIGA